MRNFRKIVFVICIGCFGLNAVAQDISVIVNEVIENNPEFESTKIRHNMLEERVNEVNSLPNTEVGIGYFVSEPETRTGAQKARFSVKQMMPWFGTIASRQAYVGSVAETAFAEIAILERRLILSTAQTYYKLCELLEKQKILDKNISLLRTYEELALTSVEAGKASAVDVLRLQIRQNDLGQQKAVIQELFDAELATLNKLRNKEVNTSIELHDSLRITLITDRLEDSISIDNHPELLKLEKQRESVNISESLNQRELLPYIGFGLDYIPVAERPNMTFDDNGKDIIMPMVTVSIPIFNNSYRSISKQNEIRLTEIDAQKSNLENNLNATLKSAQSRQKAALITVETQNKNLLQAKDAETILIRSYETGTIDFKNVLDIQELQLKFQMAIVEAVREFYVQQAMIDYLTNQL